MYIYIQLIIIYTYIHILINYPKKRIEPKIHRYTSGISLSDLLGQPANPTFHKISASDIDLDFPPVDQTWQWKILNLHIMMFQYEHLHLVRAFPAIP